MVRGAHEWCQGLWTEASRAGRRGTMRELVIVGMGQLGALFGRAALRCGVRVTPILRSTNSATAWHGVGKEAAVLLAVGLDDLAGALEAVPEARRGQVILLQNELFEPVWRDLGLQDPGVLVFWSNKKAGRPLQHGHRSGIYGPGAPLMVELHGELGVAHERLVDRQALAEELAAKYAFILTINVLGLVHDEPLGRWLERGEATVRALARDAARLAAAKSGELAAQIEEDAVVDTVIEAMEALAGMSARGRSAQARLERAREDAEALGLELQALERVARQAPTS